MNDALPMWVVYCRPLDFPQHYVVRRQWSVNGDPRPVCDPVACLYDTVEEAMFDCETKGLTWINRYTGDDPVIVGVWL